MNYHQFLQEGLFRALQLLGLKGKVVHLYLVTDEEIALLNREYLGREGPTNVISFSLWEGQRPASPTYLGEIFISRDTARREAREYGVPLRDYLLSLALHGLLHLLGYEHERGRWAPWLMARKEEELLRRLLGPERRAILNLVRRREYMPAKLAVNVDHVATVREARKVHYPDPIHAAVLAELGGAHGIVVHLRGDRRHIQERDVRLLREIIKTKLILEMAPTEEMIEFALTVKPDQVTLVPERPMEVTTEGGMAVKGRVREVRATVERLKKGGIPKVSIFINPDPAELKSASKTGADVVELHTGHYAEARGAEEMERELSRLEEAARVARDLGFEVHAGHGLSYENIEPVAAIPEIEEFSIGHAIIARAIMVGMKEAVREMLSLIEKARG